MTRSANVESPPRGLVLLLTAVLLAVSLGTAGATCKSGGTQCQTSSSCCSGLCVKPTLTHGNAVFGACCTPTTCTAQGKNCGTISNGCVGTLNCGTCTAPQTCGGGGTQNVCGCTPTTCGAHGATCGTIADGCGGTLNCGTCTAPQTCGGGSVANQCGCTPSCAGKACGDDGCGGSCGSCTAPQTCGGGGSPNQCGCTPLSTVQACAQASPGCGDVSDGCGGTVHCVCNVCACCCDNDLHPGDTSQCLPVDICPLAANPYPFTSPSECESLLCAAGCAAVCDQLYSSASFTSTALVASCDGLFGAYCPPYCGDIGESCADDTGCCDYDPSCVAGKCTN
jgi:hypothetical protein